MNSLSFSPYLVYVAYEPQVIDSDRLEDWLRLYDDPLHEKNVNCQTLSISTQPRPQHMANALGVERQPRYEQLFRMVSNKHDFRPDQKAYAVFISAQWWNEIVMKVKEWRRDSNSQIIAISDDPVPVAWDKLVRPVPPDSDRQALTDRVFETLLEIIEQKLDGPRRIPRRALPKPAAVPPPMNQMPPPKEPPAPPPDTAAAESPPAPPSQLPGRWKTRELDAGDAYAELARDGGQGWATAGVTRIGKQHIHYDKSREDAFRVARVGEWRLAAVADGGGSYQHAAEGSRLAVNAAIDHMVAVCRATPELGQDPNEISNMLRKALRVARGALEDAADAKKDGSTLRDFATTLLLVAYHTDGFLGGAQIGDGLIAAQLADGDYVALSTPESGEYASETSFLTRNDPGSFAKRIFGHRPQHRLRSIILMTDGVADDFLPVASRLPVIMDPVFIRLHEPDETAKTKLIELLGYEIRGSFDDRTLVVIYDERLMDSKELLTARIEARREAQNRPPPSAPDQGERPQAASSQTPPDQAATRRLSS